MKKQSGRPVAVQDEEVHLYLHLFSDGRVFVLPLAQEDAQEEEAVVGEGSWFEYDDAMKFIGEYFDSLDAPVLQKGSESSPEDSAARVLLWSSDRFVNPSPFIDFTEKRGLQPAEVDPHPAVTGFRKSYRPFIEDAIEASQLDIEGTGELLMEAAAELEQLPAESDAFEEAKLEVDRLQQQLREARDAHKRLQEFQLEFCFESSGVQH